MPRPKKNIPSVANFLSDNDDVIIENGLLSIRKAIIDGDWKLVCEGYNSISGENLKPKVVEKPLSRLESIRKSLSSEIQIKSLPIQKELDPKGETPEVVKEVLSDDELVDEVIITKQEGGKKFGVGEIQVFSSPFDEKEALENKKVARKKVHVPRKSGVPDEFRDMNRESSRYYSSNTPPSFPSRS